MDRPTLAAYDNDAAAFAKDWHAQPAPVDLQEIVARYFIRGGITADIGCGSGREVAWLNANGFPAVGFDASDGLLAEARSRYPELDFAHAELPESRGHCGQQLRQRAVRNRDHASRPRSRSRHRFGRMLDILKPSGILYLSWRVTDDADQRDKHGRLYAAFDASLVLAQLAAATVLLDEEVVSASSGKRIHRLVAKKTG